MIRQMTETFSAFATNGDPNNEEIKQKWNPIETADLPFECMNINQDETKLMPLPESERLKTWDEIFALEKVETI
jgi:carboxylesterase type B